MPRPDVQVLVCCNERSAHAPKPSCGPRGALAVYHRFKDRIRELGERDRVLVTRTGCLKHCSLGVTVAIWPHEVWYGGVLPEDVDEIIARTVLGGETVDRLVMPDVPWE